LHTAQNIIPADNPQSFIKCNSCIVAPSFNFNNNIDYMPSVSIILPVYNGIKYLSQSVYSVLKQDFTDFEFLVLDDCSTDGSWEWLQSLDDKRVSLFRNQQNRGLFYNFNFLIKKSSSSIIKLWSQDDVLYPNCIGTIVAFHRQYPKIGFSYTARDYINEWGNDLNIEQQDDTPEIVSTALHARIAFFTGSIAGNIANVALNKFALDKVGLFNEQMKISGDFEMWVRLAKDHPVGFINKPLVQLRNHNGQLSGQKKYFIYHLKEDIQVYQILLLYVNKIQKKEGWKLLRNYKLLFYYTLMLKEFIHGRFSTGWSFLNRLHQFDNIFLLTFYYVKNRIFFKNIPYVSKETGADL
jgi:glycosyltransferase involved in cell wall biosynthesis